MLVASIPTATSSPAVTSGPTAMPIPAAALPTTALPTVTTLHTSGSVTRQPFACVCGYNRPGGRSRRFGQLAGEKPAFGESTLCMIDAALKLAISLEEYTSSACLGNM